MFDVVNGIDQFTFASAKAIGYGATMVKDTAGIRRFGFNEKRLKGFDFKDTLTLYHPTEKGDIFYGNASVKTYSISHMAGSIEKYTGVMGHADTATNIAAQAIEEGKVGENTQIAIGAAIGEEAGGKAGAAILAAGCGFFGAETAGIGVAVCAFIGNLVGGEVGEAMTSGLVKNTQEGTKRIQREVHAELERISTPDPFSDPFNYD